MPYLRAKGAAAGTLAALANSFGMQLDLVERLRRKAAHKFGAPSTPMSLPQGAVSITFDDFPRTAWTEGGAVLAAHGVKGTYYVSGRLCGGEMDGQEQYRESDLAALNEAGHEVGCHTFDHISALKTPTAVFARSIEANARFFSERLAGWKATSFAYPYGDVSLGALRTVGGNFSSGRLVVGGCNTRALRPLRLNALALESRRPEAARWDELVAQAAAERQWLVIMTHDVQDRPSDFGCTPQTLDALLGAARKAGLRVAPVGTVMQTCAAQAAAA